MPIPIINGRGKNDMTPVELCSSLLLGVPNPVHQFRSGRHWLEMGNREDDACENQITFDVTQ